MRRREGGLAKENRSDAAPGTRTKGGPTNEVRSINVRKQLLRLERRNPGGEDVAGGAQVRLVDHFGGGVDVSGADDDADGAGAFAGLLGGGAILAAAEEDGALVGDAVLFGAGFDVVDEAVVGDEGGVHDVEAEAFALLGDFFVFGDAGGVAGEGDVDADADVAVDGVGGGFGAAEADLFLGGEDDDDLAFVRGGALLEFLDGFDAEPAGDAVIHGGGDDLLADLDEGVGVDAVVADLDAAFDLGGGEAGVNKEFLDVGDLGFVGFGGDVDGAAAGVHDAVDVAGVGDEGHAAGEEVAGVEAAGVGDADEAVGVDVADVEADLIHMAEEEDAGGLAGALGRGALGAAFGAGGAGGAGADEVAEGVGGSGIEEAADLLLQEGADALFAAGDAGGLAEAAEEVDVEGGGGFGVFGGS